MNALHEKLKQNCGDESVKRIEVAEAQKQKKGEESRPGGDQNGELCPVLSAANAVQKDSPM